MRVVIDTNCLLVCIPRQAKHRWLFDAIQEGRFEVAISTEILSEYAEQLQAFYTPTIAENVLKLLLELPKLVPTEIFFNWNLISNDPDDNKFVDCYVAANADYLVTNDRHYRGLQRVGFPPITCVTLDEFRNLISPTYGN